MNHISALKPLVCVNNSLDLVRLRHHYSERIFRLFPCEQKKMFSKLLILPEIVIHFCDLENYNFVFLIIFSMTYVQSNEIHLITSNLIMSIFFFLSSILFFD
jgi:hypothetical protein